LSQRLMGVRVIVSPAVVAVWLWRLMRALGGEGFSFMVVLANVRVWLISVVGATGTLFGLLHLAVVHGPNLIALSVVA